MTSKTATEHLFVYGTLRRDARHPMAGVLAGASTHVGRATYQGQLYRVSWYPGAVASDSPEDRVIGDVFRIHEGRAEGLFLQLDEYEGAGAEAGREALYRRERARVMLAGGEAIEAWIYLYNRPTGGLARIESGDFLAG